jgi:hypothetical protein
MPRIEFIQGLTKIECLKDKYERIVIAIVSSSMDPTEFEKARLLGVRHIFSKPLNQVQLGLISKIEFEKA